MDVIAACGMRAAALTANRSVRELEEQARRFRPELAVLMEEDAAADLKVRLADTGVRVAAGMEGLLEAASLDGATGWTMAWHMELPLAAPAILGGLRNGFALSVTGAVVGEMVMGGTGLGQVLTQMRNNVDTAGMFVIIIILCTMATLLYTIVYRVERSKRYDITQ